MLPIDTLNLFLSLNEGQLLDDFILTLLAAPQIVVLFEQYPALKQAFLQRAPLIKQRLKQIMKQTKVPPQLAQEFYLFQQAQLQSPAHFLTGLPTLLVELQQNFSPFYTEANALVHTATWHHQQPDDSLQTLFLQRWRLNLTLQTTTLHVSMLEKEREWLLDELQQQLALTGALAPMLAENDCASGRLWDMTASQARDGDYRQLVHFGEFLRQQPELHALADQLGRSREAHFVPAAAAGQQEVHQRVREPAIEREEISGIHQSDDLLRLLPGELVTLGIDELEYEFYRRLLEKRLLTYRLQGDNWRERTVKQPARSEHQQQQPRGPFIICVDTSGSMGGFNEQCAKAFCLALMRIALADNRRCYITLFSTGQISYELTGQDGLQQAIRFLAQRFRGGTDLAACLQTLVDRLATPEWHDADAVVISDFIAQRLPDELRQRIKGQQQARLQRFHAVALSAQGKPGIMKIFDYIWHFDTSLKHRLQRWWQRKRS